MSTNRAIFFNVCVSTNSDRGCSAFGRFTSAVAPPFSVTFTWKHNNRLVVGAACVHVWCVCMRGSRRRPTLARYSRRSNHTWQQRVSISDQTTVQPFSEVQLQTMPSSAHQHPLVRGRILKHDETVFVVTRRTHVVVVLTCWPGRQRRLAVSVVHPRSRFSFFWNNLFYGNFHRQKSWNSHQPGLGIRPPARLGGPIVRCDVTPVPGSLPLRR